jgi:outer membrane usher protein FimD/PapC
MSAETKLDANRNRRRRKKQAKQSRQHFREVVNRKKEKRDRKFTRMEARYKRRNYREEEAAKEEAYDRVCNVKEARSAQWWKNQKAKNLRLKKQHRGGTVLPPPKPTPLALRQPRLWASTH